MIRRLCFFSLLIGLAVVSGLVLAHGRSNAAADGCAKLVKNLPGHKDSPRASALAPAHAGPMPAPSFESAASREQVDQVLSSQSLRFIPNVGQTNAAARFNVKGAGHTIFFSPREIVFVSHAQTQDVSGQHSIVRLQFLGALPHPVVEGLEQMPGVVNFFLGNDPAQWHADVPTYQAIAYRDLYPGVDLVYHGAQGHLKSEFLLAPGVDPARIQMTYRGIEGVHVREDGALVLHTSTGKLIEGAPLIYQEINGIRRQVPGRYTLVTPASLEWAGWETGKINRISFQVGEYDPTRPLIIDPALTFATYLGGDGDEHGYGITLDRLGNIYITGSTTSSEFPTHAAIQQDHGGGSDAFVTQIISTSQGYVYGYSTYLGGSDEDSSNDIAVDEAGNTYVVGTTNSSDFPTHGALESHQGEQDSFVAKIASSMGINSLSYATYLGGSSYDASSGIALDGDGNIYVVGATESSDFPTYKAIQTTQAMTVPGDVFVTQLVSVNEVYTYGFSTYLGGSQYDSGSNIAVDAAGNVYVTGATSSDDFPTHRALQNHQQGKNAFVTQIIAAGDVYTYGYSTYLGGSLDEWGEGIAIDNAGNVYIAGITNSGDFPTHDAIQQAYGGGFSDAFVTQIISASGVYTYGYSSYLGGSRGDGGESIAVDETGIIYVTGETDSNDFPVNALQTATYGGTYDSFVTQIISDGTRIYGYSTYLGGSGYDWGEDIVVDSERNAYIVGFSRSRDFPTADATQIEHGGGNHDSFVAKISPTGLALRKVAHSNVVPPGQQVIYTLLYANESIQTIAGVVITDILPLSLSNVQYTNSGATITESTGLSYAWQVEPLSPGASGIITISGMLPPMQSFYTLTNRATITTTDESYTDPYLENNVSVAHIFVAYQLYIPQVLRNYGY